MIGKAYKILLIFSGLFLGLSHQQNNCSSVPVSCPNFNRNSTKYLTKFRGQKMELFLDLFECETETMQKSFYFNNDFFSVNDRLLQENAFELNKINSNNCKSPCSVAITNHLKSGPDHRKHPSQSFNTSMVEIQVVCDRTFLTCRIFQWNCETWSSEEHGSILLAIIDSKFSARKFPPSGVHFPKLIPIYILLAGACVVSVYCVISKFGV